MSADTQQFNEANRCAFFQTEDAAVREGFFTFDDASVQYPALMVRSEDGLNTVSVFKPNSGRQGKPVMTAVCERIPGGGVPGKTGRPTPTHRVSFKGKKEKRVFALWSYPTCLSGQLESRAELAPMDTSW